MKRSPIDVLWRNRGISAFIAVWSCGVLALGCTMASGVIRQLHTRNYAQTTGYVTRSELAQSRGVEGTTYLPKVAYVFETGGRTFTSDVLRHDAYATSELTYHEGLRARFQVGARVPVYFDSDDPQRSVLVRGDLQGSLFLAVFLMPFLYSALLMTWMAGRSLHLQCRDFPAAGLPRTTTGSTLRIRLDDQFALAFGALGCGAAVLIALLDMVVVRPHGPALGHMIALALQAAAVAAAHYGSRSRSFLELDSARNQLTRTAADPAESWSCAFGDVRALWVEERSRGAHAGDSVHRYALVLSAARDPGAEQLDIGEFSSLHPPLSLRSWLAQAISRERIPAQPPASAQPPAVPSSEHDGSAAVYIARTRASRSVAWAVALGSSAFTLPLLAAALIALVKIALDWWKAGDAWLLFAGTVGVLSVPGWLRSLHRLRPHESVLYADRTGIAWALEHRGTELPQPRSIGPSQGYIAVEDLAAIADERGRGRDQLELRLKNGERLLIPRTAASPGSRKRLIRWFDRAMPALVERPPVRICESNASAP